MNPIDRPYLNFATAYGPYDTRDPQFINCDPTLVPPPVITLTFGNGMTLTVTDAAEVLSTGGINVFACQGIPHSTPWTAVDPANVVRSGA
ncbi:MAG: hypothetical protein M3179_09155 [Actinomycetota bacterium]|nr:hypothetical protein [Actinomycetota bacterium]